MPVKTAKMVMSLESVEPDEAKHLQTINFQGTELGTTKKAWFILDGKPFETKATPVPNEPTKATAVVPDTWPAGSGQVYLEGSRDRRSNTVPLDVISA
ncbi:hypothetical protein ACFU7T_32645 [Streptomyces sp. NPDC057555]|uniref:hypothetical protein n=1 Tax=Streptomyces sp. NPDC057555 TaxID=3346166 RepID=UPI0036CF4E48